VVILTPRGKVSRYFYGINFPVRDLEFGLMEASAERIGSPIQRLLLLCYHYDPATGRYNFAIVTALQVLGTATALALGTFVVVTLRRERRLAGTPGRGALEIQGAEAGAARSGSPDPGPGDQGET
jgi:protein SCO1